MGLLDAIGQGLAYNSDEQKLDRADAREMGNYEKKLQLAQDMEYKLLERKQQLSQQFPELMRTESGYGVITGIYNDGSTKELARDEDARKAELEKVAQATESNRLMGLLSEQRAGVVGQNADAATLRAEAAARAADAAAKKAEKVGEPKPMNDSTANTIVKEATAEAMAPYVKENRISKAKDTSEWDMLTPAEQSQKIKTAVDRRTEALKLVTGGTAAASGMPGVAPATQDLGIFGDIE